MNRWQKLYKIFLLTIMVLGAAELVYNRYLSICHSHDEKIIQSELKTETTEVTYTSCDTILPKYESLYEQNSDMVGWLTIDGTNVNYPVMKSDDDEYYLHNDFNKNESKYGCLFVRSRVDVNNPGDNFIIYGHHMRDGSMFGELEKYEEVSFYKQHATVNFDTLYEQRTYEIVSVFLSEVHDEDYEGFKYYDFYEAKSKEEFDNFISNVKALQLYDTGIDVKYGDSLLTLSTCSYHSTNGRLVIVAKRSTTHNASL